MNTHDSPDWRTVETDTFRFRYTFRTPANDRGPTLEVYGLLDDSEWKEV